MTDLDDYPALVAAHLARLEHLAFMEMMMANHEWWTGVPVGPQDPRRVRPLLGLQQILAD